MGGILLLPGIAQQVGHGHNDQEDEVTDIAYVHKLGEVEGEASR
jgi:hypothetical protein